MASAFSFNDVTIFYSEKMLFNNTTLTISDGDRIGVVGKNGSGKSTFLRLLAGVEKPDTGSITVQRNMSVAYLPQTPVLREDATTTFEGWGKDTKWNTSLFHLTMSYGALFMADIDLQKILD